MSEAVRPLEQRAWARVGTSIRGKYRIVRVLGIGGMATVYAAEHRNGHRVAIKMLHPELSLRSDISARFLREGYVSNRVRHAGAVRVLDDDTAEDGAAFLVMELLDGETLWSMCRRSGGRLPCRDVLALGHQLLDVLAAAHAAGVVHRDIKPENLFLTTERVVKVLDFGIARIEDDGARATATGARLGTPAFMPPELALGRTAEIDARTDLWSTGATLFQLLSGRIVHEAPAAAEIIVRAATVAARSLATVAPDVPAPVVALVDRALAFARDDRWVSARAMAQAIEEAYAVSYGAPIAPTSLTVLPEPAPAGDTGTGAEERSGPGANQETTLPASPSGRIEAQADTVDAFEGAPRPAAVTTIDAGANPDRGHVSPPGLVTEPDPQRASGTGAELGHPPTAAPATRPEGRAPPKPAAPRRTALLLVAVALGAAGGVALLVARRGAGVPSPAPAPPAGASASPCPPGMALIPGGAFDMGTTSGRPDEQPVHRVEVGAFCLDVDEVTVGAYATCVANRGCAPAPITVERPDLTDADRLAESAACNGTQGDRITHPVNCVDHAAATHFCASLGLHLPTEEEWEYAARGGAEQRRYPWGDSDPDPTRLNACDRSCFEFFQGFGHPWGYMFDVRDGFPRTAPVGSFRAGDSRWGVHDMAGNVLEWTSSTYCPYAEGRCESPFRVYRGGGWAAVLKTTVQATWRGRAVPTVRDSNLGFRCAKALGDG